MRRIAGLVLTIVAFAWADQGTDREAVQQTLDRLNDPALRSAQFAPDAQGRHALDGALRAPGSLITSQGPLSGDYWPYWPALGTRPRRFDTVWVRIIDRGSARVEGRIGYLRVRLILREGPAGWKITSARLRAG